ncbi:hypothetical protein JKF63_02476 [Porcisia hertigi]|uniref:Uncharacterized protein n=1 Tax=Porcisia hertigi TaxID=2761500 RepID=A0A836L690_9TRYP|nr:hypothetical protein JKF63_02476 [Porcisia hertigi]
MATLAPHHSLALDQSICHHYYHCVLYDVPFDLPVSEIAAYVVPKKDSDVVQGLSSAGCRVVPHQLHVYKEPLDRKFGYVSFFIHQAPHSATDADDAHRLVCQWIDIDLASQLAMVQCKVRLAQPPECHSSEPFLDALRLKCPLLDPTLVADTKKLETFVLTRVSFDQHRENVQLNELDATHRKSIKDAAEAASCGAEKIIDPGDDLAARKAEVDRDAHSASRVWRRHEWSRVGTFSVTSLSPKELVWLKKQLPGFPQLLITNDDMETTHCDTAMLVRFFSSSLAPLFTVEEELNTAATTATSEA